VASSDGNTAVLLGSVLDSDGNQVEVYGAPDGTVVIEHVMGSVEIEPGWTTAFRELVDRAAMPAQVPPAAEAPRGPDGDDCGCGLGPERCAAAEDGDLGD